MDAEVERKKKNRKNERGNHQGGRATDDETSARGGESSELEQSFFR